MKPDAFLPLALLVAAVVFFIALATMQREGYHLGDDGVMTYERVRWWGISKDVWEIRQRGNSWVARKAPRGEWQEWLPISE